MACDRCQLPVPARLADKTGNHASDCPRTPDRVAYLAERERQMPRLALHVELLRDHTLAEIMKIVPAKD
jgi:hypothetical protein